MLIVFPNHRSEVKSPEYLYASQDFGKHLFSSSFFRHKFENYLPLFDSMSFYVKSHKWNIFLLSKGLSTTFKGFLEQIFNWRINKLLLPHNLYSCANHAPLFYCSCWHPFLAIRQTQKRLVG